MALDYDALAKVADAALERLGRASIGIVLGSGLSEAVDHFDHPQYLEYARIPGFPTTTVAGHPGALLYARCGEVPVLALCGRVHLYEGRAHDEICAPIRLLSLLGVHTLIVTSAVGSTDRALRPGHMMLVEDHLNFTGDNVLVGEHDPRFGPRFVDMTHAYDPELSSILERTAARASLPVGRGVLAHFRGPSYETPAEVRAAQALGARAVSMSMVPDVLVARQRGMRVAGIACVTNMAAGIEAGPLAHEDVLRTSAANVADLQTLLSGALPHLAELVGAGSEPPLASSRGQRR